MAAVYSTQYMNSVGACTWYNLHTTYNVHVHMYTMHGCTENTVHQNVIQENLVLQPLHCQWQLKWLCVLKVQEWY